MSNSRIKQWDIHGLATARFDISVQFHLTVFSRKIDFVEFYYLMLLHTIFPILLLSVFRCSLLNIRLHAPANKTEEHLYATIEKKTWNINVTNTKWAAWKTNDGNTLYFGRVKNQLIFFFFLQSKIIHMFCCNSANLSGFGSLGVACCL